MRGCVSETKLLLNPPTMDLKLFVLGGGQLSEDTPNFHSTNKLIFSCHECTSTEEPVEGEGGERIGGGRSENVSVLWNCRHISPLSP
jgi:hypothetical protein